MGAPVKMKLAAIIATVCLVSTTPTLAANLVNNGSFETGDLSGWNNFGNPDFIGVVCDPGIAADGICFAFGGPIGSTGGFDQTVGTVAGGSYKVEFSLSPSGSPTSSFEALFGGVSLLSLTAPPSNVPLEAYTRYSFDVTATGASALAFVFRDDQGFLRLDSVSVTEIESAVPEPSTWAMMLLGFGAMGAVVRARRRLSPA